MFANHPAAGVKRNRYVYLIGLVVMAVWPWLPINGFYVFLAQTFFYTAIAVIGLNLLLGLSGQMSLGQAGFYALGAYGSALTALKLGWPLPLSILFGTVIAAVGGALVGVFALRTRGLYLAMTTLAVGYVLDILAQRWVGLTGGTMGLMGIPQFENMSWIPAPTILFYLSGLALLFVQLIADYINDTRAGRNLRAIRESEVFAASVGVNVSRWKAVIFGFAAALAGLGGTFFAHQSGYVGSDAFSVRLSVALLIAAVVGGLGTKSGPLLGTLILLGIVELIAGIDKYGLLVYGSILLVVLLAFPKGAAGILDDLLAKLGRKPDPSRSESLAHHDLTANQAKAMLTRLHNDSTSISIKGISKSYSGLKAVDQVSIEVASGRVHGLIGPNGAGKSTVINMVAGIYQPDEGSVYLGSENLSGKDVATRARMGMARTFQNLQLIEGVSVLDNVLLGVQSQHGLGRNFLKWLLGQPIEVGERRLAMEILAFFWH